MQKVSDDVLCYQILPFLPYFYISICRRVNRQCKKFVEGYQKYLLFKRFLLPQQNSPQSNNNGSGGGIEGLIIGKSMKCQMNDLKMVERSDFERFDLIRTQNNVSLLANMIRRLYYYNELKWFLYYLSRFGNREKTVIEWKDKLYVNGVDFDELISHGEENIYEMNDYEIWDGDYDIRLSLVGVTIDDTNFFKSLQNEMGCILIGGIELVFSKLETKLPYLLQNFVHLTDCFTYMEPKTQFKTSKLEALKYIKKCARACKVVPSLVPRGELFFGLIYRKNTLDWKLCNWMYKNSVIPLFDILYFGFDIICYLFEKIISAASDHYLKEQSLGRFSWKYSKFRSVPEVAENVQRITELFSIAVEKQKQDEIFNPSPLRRVNILQMTKILDKRTASRFNFFGLQDTDHPFYSWEYDFVYGYFGRDPKGKRIISFQEQQPKQYINTKKLVEINTTDLFETA